MDAKQYGYVKIEKTFDSDGKASCNGCELMTMDECGGPYCPVGDFTSTFHGYYYTYHPDKTCPVHYPKEN